jgi:urease accessory protein UreH
MQLHLCIRARDSHVDCERIRLRQQRQNVASFRLRCRYAMIRCDKRRTKTQRTHAALLLPSLAPAAVGVLLAQQKATCARLFATYTYNTTMIAYQTSSQTNQFTRPYRQRIRYEFVVDRVDVRIDANGARIDVGARTAQRLRVMCPGCQS